MKTRLLNIYFKAPIIIDYILSIILFLIIFLLQKKIKFGIPSNEIILSVISDLSNVSLTITGFILTLLTLLITFKSSLKLKIEDVTNDDSKFDIFFASELYFETNKHLKNAMKSLLFIAIIGYAIKLISISNEFIIYFFSVIMLVVLILTLLRCLLILNLILNYQRNNKSKNHN